MGYPIIKVHQGQLRGIVEKNVYETQFVAFRGIPYGKPPVDNLRFKDPEPAEPWPGTRDAFQFGNKCAQIDVLAGKLIGSEDCLFLNIYTSNLNPTTPRAVMVWIHGGSFSYGSGDDDMHGPDYFIEKDIVLVTINYRLGILGFLDLEDEVAPGNQGLKDQVLALKWIQQNISKFGGDSHNVTIFGESAGAASIHYLTASPLAQGLFHKAIAQSGVAINPWATLPHSGKEKAQKLSSMLGMEITDPEQLVEFLRTIDIRQLLEKEYSFETWQNKLLAIGTFRPTVDSKSKNPFMPISMQEAAKKGVKVPCMVGYVSHEAICLLAGITDDNFAEIDANQENLLMHANMKKSFKERNISVKDVKKVFMGDDKIELKNIDKLIDLMSTCELIIGIHQVLEIQANISRLPTYLYYYEYESEKPFMQKLLNTDLKGTCHGEELKYQFAPKLCKLIGQDPPAPGSTEYLISRRFVELWTNFAITGNPTPQTSELLPIYWKPIDNPTEYNCLKISDDLNMIKIPNILLKIINKVKELK